MKRWNIGKLSRGVSWPCIMVRKKNFEFDATWQFIRLATIACHDPVVAIVPIWPAWTKKRADVCTGMHQHTGWIFRLFKEMELATG